MLDLSNILTQVFIIVTLEILLSFVALATMILRTKKNSSVAKDKNPLLTKPQTNVPAPIERIGQLKSEKGALRHEPRKQKRKSSETVAYSLLLSGAISIIASIIYSASILAFIGLGVTFWGALLLFIKPTKYVKASFLNSTTLSSLTLIDQIITNLNYKGKAIYLPPRYIKAVKGGIMFIPLKENIVIPPAEQIAEEKVFLRNPKGICLTPLGLDLENIYENELGKNFVKVDLNYLQNNLPKLFIEDLEIAENIEINIKGKIIQVKITESIYNDFCKEARKLSNICKSLGCPLCSSLAIALTRATGKPIIIKKHEFSQDDKTIEVYYKIVEE